MSLMRLAALKCCHIRNFEVHRVLPTMISGPDGHINLMKLRARAGAILRNLACLLADMASAGKGTASDTVLCTPTASTSKDAASVVDLLGSIAAFIVACRRTIAVEKTRWTFETLEKKQPF